jgi:hypothetical protein
VKQDACFEEDALQHHALLFLRAGDVLEWGEGGCGFVLVCVWVEFLEAELQVE